MVWTDPRKWIAGEVVTGPILNTHLRDNLLALRWGAWQGWTAAGITYGSTVADFGSGYNAAQVRTTGDGREVEIRGLLSVGSLGAGGTVFTLPAGMRPIVQELRAITTNGTHARLDFLTSGGVTNGMGTLSGVYLSVTGVAWSTY